MSVEEQDQKRPKQGKETQGEPSQDDNKNKYRTKLEEHTHFHENRKAEHQKEAKHQRTSKKGWNRSRRVSKEGSGFKAQSTS